MLAVGADDPSPTAQVSWPARTASVAATARIRDFLSTSMGHLAHDGVRDLAALSLRGRLGGIKRFQKRPIPLAHAGWPGLRRIVEQLQYGRGVTQVGTHLDLRKASQGDIVGELAD